MSFLSDFERSFSDHTLKLVQGYKGPFDAQRNLDGEQVTNNLSRSRIIWRGGCDASPLAIQETLFPIP